MPNKTSLHTQTQQMQAAADPYVLLVDKILAMKESEQYAYLYKSYLRSPHKPVIHISPEEFAQWRSKICHWAFSVIDHFDLSRRTVAICVDIFDRYLATRGNRCDGTRVLLISLTTLYIAIKVNESKTIELSTIAELSGGRFFQRDVEDMEVNIMQSLSWLLHPPIPVDFISYILKFLPPDVPMPVRRKIFELARYMGEISICDLYFVEIPASTIAFASILNAIEDDVGYDDVCWETRQRFFIDLYRDLNLYEGRDQVRGARDRLRRTLCRASGDYVDKTNGESREPSELAVAVARMKKTIKLFNKSDFTCDTSTSQKIPETGKLPLSRPPTLQKSFILTIDL